MATTNTQPSQPKQAKPAKQPGMYHIRYTRTWDRYVPARSPKEAQERFMERVVYGEGGVHDANHTTTRRAYELTEQEYQVRLVEEGYTDGDNTATPQAE